MLTAQRRGMSTPLSLKCSVTQSRHKTLNKWRDDILQRVQPDNELLVGYMCSVSPFHSRHVSWTRGPRTNRMQFIIYLVEINLNISYRRYSADTSQEQTPTRIHWRTSRSSGSRSQHCEVELVSRIRRWDWLTIRCCLRQGPFSTDVLAICCSGTRKTYNWYHYYHISHIMWYNITSNLKHSESTKLHHGSWSPIAIPYHAEVKILINDRVNGSRSAPNSKLL